MEKKIETSLQEVHDMKEKNLEDYKNSGFESYIEYLANEIKNMGYHSDYFIKEPKPDYLI